jgi:hypothetical protein
MANPFEITDDVLRSMTNLNKENEPNWLAIKKWLSLQLVHYQNAASLGINFEEKTIRQYQGTCTFLYNLTNWIENPEEELKIREAARSRSSKPNPIKVS